MGRILRLLNIRRYSPEKQREFLSNLLLGIFTIIALAFIRDTSIGQEIINGWLDIYMNFQEELVDDEQVNDEIVFLDFNNQSLQQMGYPEEIPRDKIADLVKIAYEGGAKIIIVDHIFSQPDYDNDEILYDLLQEIRDDSSTDTKVLLPTLTYLDDKKDIIERKNIFADLIDDKKIFGITPTFTKSEGDSSVRFWSPYLKIKTSDTHEETILWSIPVLTVVLVAGNLDELHALEPIFLNDSDEVKPYHLKINLKGVERNFTIYNEKLKNGDVIRDTQSEYYNRIWYTLHYNYFGENIGHWSTNNTKENLPNCNGKIVIIGRADDNCKDFHETPIDTMPGMYVHGNSVATVLSEMKPHLCSTFKQVLLDFLLVIVAAYMFLYFSEVKAICAIVVMFIFCLAGTCIYYCYTCEFVGLSMAFANIEIYDVGHIIGGKAVDFLLRRLP